MFGFHIGKFLTFCSRPDMLSPRQSQLNLLVTIYNNDIYSHLLVFTIESQKSTYQVWQTVIRNVYIHNKTK